MDSTLHLLDDLDGWPVRLDDDAEMDLLDFDNAIPGSFGDFAAWMSGAAEATEVAAGAQTTVDVPPGVIYSNAGSSRQTMPQGGAHTTQNVSETILTQPAGQAAHIGVTVPEQQQQINQAMRQNSAHSQALTGAAPSSTLHHRPPSAHDSFRSQHSVPDAAALSAAAGKAQQLLISASSGFPASATPAVNTPAGGGFLPPQALGGGVAFPPAAFSPRGPHHHLLASPAAAAGQAALLLGGANPAAAAAMAAMQHSNPFAAAAAAASLPGFAQAAAMQGMGLTLGLGGHIAAGHHQGYALHPNTLHTLMGHGVLKHSALERQQKARKKNTVASLEAELSEKLSQLQLLSAENEMLKLRAGVLEATVQNREDQMRVVWEHGPPTFPIDCPDGVCALTGHHHHQQQQQQQQGEEGHSQGQPGGSSSDADGGCGDQQQQHQRHQKALGVAVGSGSSAQLAGMWDDDDDDDQPAVVVAPQMPTTPSAKAGPASSASAAARTASNCSNLSAAAAAAAAAAAPADSPSSSSNRDGGSAANSSGVTNNSSTFDEHTARLPLPQQKDSLLSIKRMTDVDVLQHWKNFLQEVTSALVQLQREESAAAAAAGVAPAAGGSSGAQQQQQQEAVSSPQTAAGGGGGAAAAVSPAEQRVRDLVDKYCYLVRTSQTLNPSAYCRLFGRHLDTGETLPYNDSHWRNVVAVLGLSKDQVTHILACAELYFSSRAKLQAEQRALQAQLKAAELSPLDLLGGDANNPLRPWLERLASNLKREHNLRIMLNSYVWGRIFSHVQKAKAAVYSHPLYVDIHALVCVMCEDALAAAGAPRGNSAQQQQQQQQQQSRAQAQHQAQLQQQQQFAAAYTACQQQQQQQMAGYMQYMAGHALV